MTYWWENKPWRLIQTNLREIDMLDIDAERVVADLKAFQANVLMINAAGIIASYPTKLPYHYQSPYLKGDSLADIIEACHRADIRVIARTDFSKVRRPIYEMHPDWAYRTADGRIVDYNGDVHVCINGDYQQIYALNIIEELLTTHDVDGIFFNMGGYQTRDYSGNYYGICHCAKCQTLFREMFGLELPKAEDMSDPIYRKYLVFKRRTLAAHRQRVWDHIHRLRPEICIDKEFSLKRGYIRQESNTAVARPLPHWQYSASANTKWAVSSYPQMVSSNTTVDFIDFPYRHVAVSPHQQKLRLAQNLANGGQLDYYLIGRLDNHEDRSGFEPVKEMFRYHAAHGDDYVGNVSKANIMLLNTSHLQDNEAKGWFRFLAESHFLFDAPIIDVAADLDWNKYELIIIPDIRPLSDELAQRLDAFVAQGGTLLAVGQTGFWDADYEPRSAPALKCLGIKEVELVKEDMRSSYLKLDDKAGFPRFAETDLIYIDGPYVYAKFADTATGHFKLVPPHNFGPPERCYYTTVVDRPGFVVNKYGKGQAIYIPWLPGTLFHRQGHTNTLDFVADLIENIAGVEPIKGNLSPMVEVTHFTNPKKGFELVHLVNTSGHFGTTFYKPITMHDLRFTVRCDKEPSAVVSLVRGIEVCHTYREGSLELHIPQLELFEAIKLSF